MATQNDITAIFWGKYENEKERHALAHHCADVACTMEALLNIPLVERTFLNSCKLTTLDKTLKARLCVLAFWHDVGKVAIGFQSKVWHQDIIRPVSTIGHCKPVADLIMCNDTYADWFFDAIDEETLRHWDSAEDNALCSMFLAALSHHGKPIQGNSSECMKNKNQWEPTDGLNPKGHVLKMRKLSEAWFPDAFVTSNSSLPAEASFHHVYLGYLALADWLSSDTRQFSPFVANLSETYIHAAREKAARAVVSINWQLDAQREDFCSIENEQKFAHLFGYTNLLPLQNSMRLLPTHHRAVVLESETGSGKTESALIRFTQLYTSGEVDSLYFAVPTRTAAVQLFERVCKFVNHLFPGTDRPEPILAVPGYLRAGDIEGIKEGYTVIWDDDATVGVQKKRWAAENSKRYLAAQIAVGTVDQAMMSAIGVKHAHLRASCLTRSLLVIDELHASDIYQSKILEHLIERHTRLGGHVLMMSATLGAEAVERWLSVAHDTDKTCPQLQAYEEGRTTGEAALKSAQQRPYPLISLVGEQIEITNNFTEMDGAAGNVTNGLEKSIAISLTEPDHIAIAKTAISAATAGAKVLILRNRVGDAIELFQTIESLVDDTSLLFSVNNIATLHHGRFAAEDRRLLDKAVEKKFGKSRLDGGCVVVGTQTLEMSLDLDADFMITDLCPIDVLLQRVGRLYRHDRKHRPPGYETPQLLVVTPDKLNLSVLLKSSQLGLGPKSPIYPNLVALQATLELIAENPIWRIPSMNRFLVEGALHSQVTSRVLTKHGPDWQRAHIEQAGSNLADEQTARGFMLKDDLFFYDSENVFMSDINGQRAVTRLGSNNLTIQFSPSVTGAFGSEITSITIPAWMLKEEDFDTEPVVEVRDPENTVLISYLSTNLSYNRFGLQTLTNND